jgi:cell wall-associated NlpC family hydrolase
VQAGDSLWRIAREHDTRPGEIASLNGLSVNAPLRLGQALKIPGRYNGQGAQAASPSPVSAPAAQAPPAQPAAASAKASSRPEPAAYTPQSAPSTPATVPPVQFDPEFEEGIAGNVPGATPPPATGPSVGQPRPSTPPPAAPIARPTVEPEAPKVAVAPSRLERPLTPAERRRLAQIPSRGERWTTSMFGVAKRYLGVRYRWGGTSPRGFDCSGFMQYVFARVGVALPRTTFDMFAAGAPVPTAELQAGDLVFFQTVSPGPSHAGIYLGDGRFIHSSSGYRGVTITAMSMPYYQARYLGARRF